jgi:divalent metal cation (Fe/Co/Zn/Cd) transporter
VQRQEREAFARRERTLKGALLLSLWGPLLTGIAVLLSQSLTQVADFVRRSVELVALAVAWLVFRHVHETPGMSEARMRHLERRSAQGVAIALAVSGGVMLLLTLARWQAFEEPGDVRLGLAVASLGLVANTWFWRRYRSLERERASDLIGAQRRLYRAKAAVDLVVIASLGTLWIVPDHAAARIVDVGGSLAVACYLLWSSHRTLQEG